MISSELLRSPFLFSFSGVGVVAPAGLRWAVVPPPPHTLRPEMRSPLPSFPRVLRGDTPQIRSSVPRRGLPLGLPAPCLSAFTSFSSTSPSGRDVQ